MRSYSASFGGFISRNRSITRRATSGDIGEPPSAASFNNITEASSLNKALTKTTVMNVLVVTNIPVAMDAKKSFMSPGE